jgi:hypothetical protein
MENMKGIISVDIMVSTIVKNNYTYHAVFHELLIVGIFGEIVVSEYSSRSIISSRMMGLRD